MLVYVLIEKRSLINKKSFQYRKRQEKYGVTLEAKIISNTANEIQHKQYRKRFGADKYQDVLTQRAQRKSE